MPARKPRSDDKSQSERFTEKARELETNDDPAAFEELFGKLVPPVLPKPAEGADPRKPKG